MNREGPIQRVNIILAKLHKYITENTGNLSDDSSDEIETLYEELEELVDWCDDLDLACGQKLIHVYINHNQLDIFNLFFFNILALDK